MLMLCCLRPACAAELAADPGSLPGLLEGAKGGEVILLGAGNYPALTANKEYPEYVTLRAKPGEKPVFTGGISLEGVARMRLDGLKFTWPEGGRTGGAKTFISIRKSHDIEVANCEIVDDPGKTEWVGKACLVRESERVTIRDCSIHHVNFGIHLDKCKNAVVDRLEIGPWNFEDAIRVQECEGPVLIQNCHIQNTGVRGPKGGHIDAIQVQFWSDNVTIRNCRIHGMMQAIGVFYHGGKIKGEKRRKNWRIEGNLIYDIYTPHVCTIGGTDGVVIVNNTFPYGLPLLSDTTEVVIKNNIFAGANMSRTLDGKVVKEADYNLYVTPPAAGTPLGPHCLAGVDPKFVNAPAALVLTRWGAKDCTRTKFITNGNLGGKIAVGDHVELMNPDGMARDGVARKVTQVGDNWFEVDKPMDVDPVGPVVLIYNWKNNQNLKPDYRLRPDSPAIDSADGGVGREKDIDGNAPFDVPNAPNQGAGQPAFLDRGAYEYVSGK